MRAPDVLGMEWEEAEELLREAGWVPALERTGAPASSARPGERLRVVRVTQGPGQAVTVLVAPERFLERRPPPEPAGR
nr:PASTA domain-containing protein [Limnochorda pilosa]